MHQRVQSTVSMYSCPNGLSIDSAPHPQEQVAISVVGVLPERVDHVVGNLRSSTRENMLGVTNSTVNM